MRRSGKSLIAGGMLATVYFVGTDPAVSAKLRRPLVRHHMLAGSSQNLIDAVDQGRVGTELGVGGSATVMAVGVYLFSRKPV